MDILKNRMKLKDLSVNIYSLHDKIKSPHHLPASMIINSDTSEFGDGEHWVSIYVDTDKNVFYFDTFGVILDPVYRNIASWGSSFRPMIYNKKHILKRIINQKIYQMIMLSFNKNNNLKKRMFK